MLEAFTVLNLASVGPAARAAQVLADYGARVIQIAPVASAAGKQIRPVHYAYGAGRGTRRLHLDLKQPRGQALFRRMAKSADAVLESFRPGVTRRLGIDYDHLSAANPRLVYCSTSGYGQAGPYAQWAGHDINYLALSGMLDCAGRDANGVPALPGATVGDSAGGGMHAGLAIMAALLERQTTGRGRYLDVAVTDGVLSMMSLNIDQYLATGIAPEAGTELLTGRYAWYGVYRTRDQRFVSVGAIESRFYRNLCRCLDLSGFADRQYDDDAQPALREALTARFLSRDRDDWISQLAAEDTCVAPVLAVAELTDDPHFQARHSFAEIEHPAHGRFRQLAPVLAGAERGAPATLPTDADTDAVLAELGCDAAEIAALRTAQIVE